MPPELQNEQDRSENNTTETQNQTMNTILVGEDDDGTSLTIEEIKKLLDLSDDRSISRFKDIATLGLGGIGAVFSATQPVLNREIALKILRPAYRNKAKYIQDFIKEARATAQIDHPNIVPVHNLGVFDDVGVYFTMKRVAGQNLRTVLKKIDQGDTETARKFTLRRLLEIFISSCNGVAFAHSKGIIHRDLKPANIMLGDYGEVFVMDWGLVKYHSEKDSKDIGQKIDLDADVVSASDGRIKSIETVVGTISGTPAFMAPEQVAGLREQIDQQTDLYSLGAILYSILTCKSSPFEDEQDVDNVLRKVAQSDYLPPRKRTPARKIPVELEAICLKAMSRRKSDRYPTVNDLISDIRNYLDNYPVSAYSPHWAYRFLKMCRRHPLVPLAVTTAFLTAFTVLATMHLESTIRQEAMLFPVTTNIFYGDTAYQKALNATFQLEKLKNSSQITAEKRQQLSDEIQEYQSEFENYYESALELLGNLQSSNYNPQETTDRIVDIFLNKLRFYLLNDNSEQVRQTMRRLRKRSLTAYMQLMDKEPETYQKAKQILNNIAPLQLNTNPAGATVLCQEQNEDGTLRPPVELGTTPLQTNLSAGNFVLTISAPEVKEIRYPIYLSSTRTNTIDIDLPKEWPENSVYIPAGNFIYSAAISSQEQAERFLDGFFISRTEVTIEEYLDFWKQLPDELKVTYMAKCTNPTAPQQAIDMWDQAGNLIDSYSPQMPIVGISPQAAAAYCLYLGDKTKMTCRLPTIEEWEKAARGVDGRSFVWGGNFRNSAALTANNAAALMEFPHSAPVGSFPEDASIYGVLDMAGNVREFVSSDDLFGTLRPVKGGSFKTDWRFSRCAAMSYCTGREDDVGFRYVMELK